MKTNVRFVVAAIILASIAALGFSRGAWAGPLMEGTVPTCPSSGSGATGITVDTCFSSVTVDANGYTLVVTEIDITQFGMAPGAHFFGPGVNVLILDKNNNPVDGVLVEVCFADPTAAGIIYRWWSTADWQKWFSTADAARWAISPTYYKTGGLTCTQSWLSGNYTIVD